MERFYNLRLIDKVFALSITNTFFHSRYRDEFAIFWLIVMMVCDHEYNDDNDNDIQVSCIPRRTLMCYLFRISS